MLDMDKKTSSERVQLNNETANRTITESQLSEQMSTESTMDHRTLMELGPSGDFKIPYSSSRANLPELKRMDTSISGDDVVAKKSLCRMRPDQSEVMLESVLKDAGNDLKSGCLQWIHVFKESEEFENFCPNRVDKLLSEAKALEENLLQQKQQLMQRLKALSRTLKMD
ncbi:uncharacterized protein [Apostichopus japonicus]|uniref:uncharacterized protein n=1 Tax=Stichopus japonicus TaxID=307972 RepID=UPI003AB54275